jgi:diacylglycerol kinase
MRGFLKGFVYAYNGLVVFFRHERNGRIQLVVAIAVVIMGALVKITNTEWIAMLLCIAAVLSLEMMNSAIEKICNLVHPTYHPAIKTIKDMAAAAVLFASIVSTVIGAIIFLPKILQLL